MAYRKKLNRRQSAKKFKRGTKTHKKNVVRGVMRGGIRT